MTQQQPMEIKMARFENSPWGFRLHGGADFGTPLSIQKVSLFSTFCTIIISSGFSSHPSLVTVQIVTCMKYLIVAILIRSRIQVDHNEAEEFAFDKLR